MLERLERAWISFRFGCKQRFEQVKREESGMATLEMVILIVVAVIIVGIVLNLITSKGFEKPSNGETCGLISYLFDLIKTKLSGTLEKDYE